MTDSTPTLVPDHETMITNSPVMTMPTRDRRVSPTPPRAANPLERLVQLMQSNDRLMAELGASRERIVQARAYLDQPGCNAGFGVTYLERCRSKHSGILAQLRANRIEALGLLDGNVVER